MKRAVYLLVDHLTAALVERLDQVFAPPPLWSEPNPAPAVQTWEEMDRE